MGERHSEFEREENDWYVEPDWTVYRLIERVTFVGRIHDPCCGRGTIPEVFTLHTNNAVSGADLVNRGYGYSKINFFEDERMHPNIVTNPPYKIAQRVIEHALKRTDNRVAVLTQIKFLASQGRHKLFTDPRMEKVLIFSRRPSMPTGQMLEEHGEEIRGGGSIDYCWLVWNQSKRKTSPTVEWLK
jgi:hypothetical protein